MNITRIIDEIDGIEINEAWLVSITTEMALNYNTGLINRMGSPFSQFRKFYKECPRKKDKALLWTKNLLEEKDVKPTNYFLNTVKKINAS